MKLELGRHLSRLGKFNEAAAPLTESFQLFREIGRSNDPNALRACERLANVHHANGNLKEAEYYLHYQRGIVEAAHGTESAAYCMVLQSEANHLYIQSRFDEAVTPYEQAASLAESIHGKNSRLYEGIINGLIDVHLARGDMPAVVNYYEERLEFELNRREKLFNVYTEQEQFIRIKQDGVCRLP